MAFVHGYSYDVFISYAHVDDQPPVGEEEGWVTTLVGELKKELKRKLGGSGASWWMDESAMAGNIPIPDQILDAVDVSAVLVVFLSAGYLKSEWCHRERNKFLKQVGKRTRSRLFIVEQDNVERSELPNEFGDLLGYPFWEKQKRGTSTRRLGFPKPTPKEEGYYDLVIQLTADLSMELESLAQLQLAAEKSGHDKPVQILEQPVAESRRPVFLAEVTDDLDPQRNELKRYLEQAGLHVLPNRVYAREPTAFRQALEEDLARCDLFVQLLSPMPGKKTQDLSQGYVGLQLECARREKKSILQWRDRTLDTSTIDDSAHAALLKGDTVIAMGIEEFKHEAKKRAFYQPDPSPPKRTDTIYVFVDMESNDSTLADEVIKVLARCGVGYALPLDTNDPGAARRDLEENLLLSDGMIVIYGESTHEWVRHRLLKSMSTLKSRQQPLPVTAIYEGPPEPKKYLAMNLPELEILNCRSGLDERELTRFLKHVRSSKVFDQ